MRQLDAKKLITWYGDAKRTLPWRESSDPYWVLVSEIMLQQTTVAAVVPKFEAWMNVFPSFERLAEAKEEEVLSQWSGLGYYQRARRLHRCAQSVVSLGYLPTTLDELLELPGIGPYTAAAVASICFERPHLAIDTNVIRVLYRYYALPCLSNHKPTHRVLQQRTESAFDWANPGEFNQALMELGASHCSVRAPECAHCPLKSGCAARVSEGGPEAFPLPKVRKEPKRTPGRSFVLESESSGRVLLVQGTSVGLLGQLYQPPILFSENESTCQEAIQAWLEGNLEESPIVQWELSYGISGRKLVLDCGAWRCSAAEIKRLQTLLQGLGIQTKLYNPVEETTAPPLSTLTRKVLAKWTESLSVSRPTGGMNPTFVP